MPERFRWLVIGVGDITTRRVLPAIEAEPRSEIYGIVTRSPEKGRRYTSNVWTGLEEALRDPAIDIVYVGSPVALHAPQTIASLRAGKHVLCEKPVAMNYAEARAMQAAAEESGRTFGVAYYRRMYPKVRRARELLAEGVIGRPVLAEANAHSWFEVVNGFRGWLVEPELSGGGPLYDVMSHRIDLFNFFFGEPKRACGQLSNVVHQWRVEDSATILIEYGNLVRCILDGRWHTRPDRDQFRIIGTAVKMNLSPLNAPDLVYPGGHEQLPIHSNLHYPCIENYIDALEGKAELAATGASSIWTDWVTERVMAQARAV